MSVQEFRDEHPDVDIEFQYILCVGSRLIKSKLFKGDKSFNTSYVSVQVVRKNKKEYWETGFNTSYVSVQEMKKLILSLIAICFNTSYVSVQESHFH